MCVSVCVCLCVCVCVCMCVLVSYMFVCEILLCHFCSIILHVRNVCGALDKFLFNVIIIIIIIK